MGLGRGNKDGEPWPLLGLLIGGDAPADALGGGDGELPARRVVPACFGNEYWFIDITYE